MGVISEAGCPAIADPGADVVAIAQRKGLKVRPLVGPSSILMGLMGSGFNGQSFAFIGYLPIEAGARARKLKEMEQRIVKEGHQIASHSVSHPYFPNMSAQEQRQEIESSLSDIKKASDVSTRTFRAPYGAFGVDEWKNNATLIDRNVLWDVDTLDWKRPGEKQITKEVVDYVHNGAVVLMHSGGGDRSQTVKALPEIIKQLKKKGYSFVTIDELCKMAGLPEAAEPSR